MDYVMNLIEQPEQPTLAIRGIQPVGRLPEFFSHAYGSIMAYLAELGESPSGMPYSAYFNLDMNALDLEAGFPVGKALPGKGEISAGVIPGGKFITTIHRGPYDTISPAYDALTRWASDHRLSPSGVAYEYYLNDPSENPDIVAETEIRLPVS